MKSFKGFSLLGVGLVCLAFTAPNALAAQQTDPFYLGLLEKGQKSFLARNYDEAARDLEIAAFGLLEDKTLRAKAYIYLSLCKYYLKDITSSEKSLREAAALMGEEGFERLEIYETAWPDLEKLMTFFSIAQAQVRPLPEEVAKPAPPASKASIPKPHESPPKQDEKASGAPEPKSTRSAQGSGTDPAAKDTEDPQKADFKLDAVKEGDLLPLDLLDTPPTAIRRVPAVYPSYAGASSIEGTVMINVLVSEKGDVIKTEIVRGLKGAFGFDQAAQTAVRRWKFEPGSIRGIRVKVWIPIAIEFKKGAAF